MSTSQSVYNPNSLVFSLPQFASRFLVTSAGLVFFPPFVVIRIEFDCVEESTEFPVTILTDCFTPPTFCTSLTIIPFSVPSPAFLHILVCLSDPLVRVVLACTDPLPEGIFSPSQRWGGGGERMQTTNDGVVSLPKSTIGRSETTLGLRISAIAHHLSFEVSSVF